MYLRTLYYRQALNGTVLCQSEPKVLAPRLKIGKMIASMCKS